MKYVLALHCRQRNIPNDGERDEIPRPIPHPNIPKLNRLGLTLTASPDGLSCLTISNTTSSSANP